MKNFIINALVAFVTTTTAILGGSLLLQLIFSFIFWESVFAVNLLFIRFVLVVATGFGISFAISEICADEDYGMNLTFNPLDPREVADTINLLRVLGAIDAAVAISIDGEPTLTEAEARKMQADVQRRFNMWRAAAPSASPAPSIDIGDL